MTAVPERSTSAAGTEAQRIGSTAFRSSVPYTDERGDTFVINCVDPRFRKQTEEFLEQALGLKDEFNMKIPGGVGPLMPQVGFAHKLTKGWLDTLFGKFKPKRIVCIAHEACAAYQIETGNSILNVANMAFKYNSNGRDISGKQREHLKGARGTLRGWYPGVTVLTYFAKIVEEGSERWVEFEKVE